MYASNLDFAGLYTFPNPLAKVPVGALLQADNLVGNKDGVGECRRGLAAAGTTFGLSAGQWASQFFSYQNRLMVSLTSGVFSYDFNGSLDWTANGTFSPPTGATKMRGVEANKNFYLTSSVGIQKMATYNQSPINSGVPPGLDGTGALAGAGSGFLGSNSQCAYQIVFGYIDANGNLNLGAPSERILVVNSTGGSDNVTLAFTVPQGLSTNYFYQIYRTAQTTYSVTPALNIPPGAEPLLSAQYNLTASNISTLQVSFTDVTTDALLGAALYTNPSQQGALQPNSTPPLSVDMCLLPYAQLTLYANNQTLQSTMISMISVGAPNGVQVGDTITINGILFTAANSQNNSIQNFAVSTSGTISQNIDTTARNLIQCINFNAASTNVYAIYLSGYNDLPGLIELQAISFSVSSFAVTSSRGGAYSPVIPSSGTSYSSSNDVTPNAIYVSKSGQPEAVPSVNIYFIGGGDQPIYRVLPLRQQAIVLKSDGVFVVTGNTPSTLTITPLDTTIICLAPETAQLLNNSVYCMSNQGVVAITESGVTIQSRAIEQDLISLTTAQYTNFKSCCFAVSYESERLYLLAMPTNFSDTYGTQIFVYNWVTNVWTHWPIDISAGIINPVNNRLYCGRPSANFNLVYQERKNYQYSDFMDDQFSVTITAIDPTGLILTLASTPSATWVGYGLDQTVANVEYIAIITAVNTSTNQITVDILNSTTPNTIIPWAVAGAQIDVPIPIAMTYAPMTAGFPHYLKDWSRVNFWFNGGNFQLIEAGFQSDIQGGTQYIASQNKFIQSIITGGYGFGPYGSTPYGGSSNFPQCIQTLVPNDVCKARWIQPILILAFPQTRLSCLGVTASYEIVSDVSG